ncbi:hypothetical protein [Cognatishimia activa]|nr:hypothetical protein [Cognatishimia activa]
MRALDRKPWLGYRRAMAEDRAKPKKQKPVTREDRLKAALKANMGRRKAQARARSADSKGLAADNQDKG